MSLSNFEHVLSSRLSGRNNQAHKPLFGSGHIYPFMDAVFPESAVESLYFQCYPNAEDGVSNAENAGEFMSSHDIFRVTGCLGTFT
jgi:hypothetical protein